MSRAEQHNCDLILQTLACVEEQVEEQWRRAFKLGSRTYKQGLPVHSSLNAQVAEPRHIHGLSWGQLANNYVYPPENWEGWAQNRMMRVGTPSGSHRMIPSKPRHKVRSGDGNTDVW